MGRDRAWLAVAALIVAGAVLRVGPAFEFWLNADEGLYDYIAHAPYALARVPMTHNAHPPGYFWLLRGVAWLGDGFVWLRLPSLLAGVATIPAMYLLGREVAGRVGAVAAAAAIALSPGAIALSQVARQYALLGLLLTLATLFFLRFLRARRRRDLAAYTGCLLAALFVQYGSFVLPVAVATTTLVLLGLGRVDARAGAAIGVAHLPIAAAAVLLFVGQIQPNLVGRPMQREAVEGWLASSFATAPSGLLASCAALFEYLAGTRFGIATAAAFAAGLAACLARRRVDVAVLTLAGLATAMGLALAGLYPFGGTRHSFHLAPLLVLPLAIAVDWLTTRTTAVRVAAALTGALLVVATGPLGGRPGLFGPRPSPPPELVIPRREVATLGPVLSELLHSPGVTVTDLETIYTLSPLMRAAGAWPHWFGSPPVAVYRFGAQLVVVAPVWQVDGGAGARGSRRRLAEVLRAVEAGLPEAAALLAGGATVISADGDRLLESLPPPTRRAEDARPVRVVARSPHVSVFHLDIPAYRASLDAQRRRRNGAGP